VIIPKKTFRKWLSGYLTPAELPLLPRRSEKRTLLIQAPERVPGVGIILTLSHSREKVKWHLLVKHILEGLNENERIVLILLTVGRNEEEYRFFKEILEFDFLQTPMSVRIALLQKIADQVSAIRPNPTLCLTCWKPSLSFNRFWFEKKRFPPVQYIGVGYKDKGSLNDSALGVEAFLQDLKPDVFPNLLFIFRITLGLPLVPDNCEENESFSSRKRIRLTSTRSAKRGRV
jgi:hypothetical protein